MPKCDRCQNRSRSVLFTHGIETNTNSKYNFKLLTGLHKDNAGLVNICGASQRLNRLLSNKRRKHC